MRARLFSELNNEYDDKIIEEEKREDANPLESLDKRSQQRKGKSQGSPSSNSSKGANIGKAGAITEVKKNKIVLDIQTYSFKEKEIINQAFDDQREEMINISKDLSEKLLNYLLSKDFETITVGNLKNLLARLPESFLEAQKSKVIDSARKSFNYWTGKISTTKKGYLQIDTSLRFALIKIS